MLLAGLLSVSFAFATADVSDSAANVRERILSEIQQGFNSKTRTLDSTIARLNTKVADLDSLIKASANPKERMEKLVERVQIIEARQKAMEENELNVYEANYQSAVINLVSMDREIKPLLLFRATKDFFNTLTETTNPANYDGFQPAFDKFRAYVERSKEHNVMLQGVSDIISATGSLSFGIPLAGAYSQLLFSGMAHYVNNIGHRRREMRTQAEQMFAITTALGQFTTDKNMIENEWDGITSSLSELQVYYDSSLAVNLRMINIPGDELRVKFTRENDADKRYAYLSCLRQKALDYVATARKEHPKEWKEMIYYQLMDVQLLKSKYGDIACRIRRHIDKYDVLFARYKTNKYIGSHIAKLDQKLGQLKSTFDDTFEPNSYVHAAMQMYKVM